MSKYFLFFHRFVPHTYLVNIQNFRNCKTRINLTLKSALKHTLMELFKNDIVRKQVLALNFKDVMFKL